MPDGPLYERRRYSSALLSHANLTDVSDLRRLLGKAAGRARPVQISAANWQVHRLEVLAETSYYPKHVVDPVERERKGGFVHEIYTLSTHLPSLGRSALLIASPYVRLLGVIFDDVRPKLSTPAPQYIKVDMDGVYEAFTQGFPDMRATQVTLQMLGEPDTLELVTLAGKSPLRSDLRSAISSVASPYSLRAEVRTDARPARVNFDRHGNFWWYLLAESRLKNIAEVVSRLDRLGALGLSRSVPLDRASDEDE